MRYVSTLARSAFAQASVAWIRKNVLATRERMIITISLAVVIVLVSGYALTRSSDDHKKPQTVGSLLPPNALSVATAFNGGTKVSAWLPWWDDGTGLTHLKDNASKFESLHLFWYEARSPTDIAMQARNPAHVLDAAKQANVRLIPTVTETLKWNEFQALLTDETQRHAHVDALCHLGSDSNFSGIDLDYETFALDVPADQIDPIAKSFVNFVKELGDCLHAQHRQVEVTVNARKTNAPFAEGSTHLASGVFDYKELGKVADQVHLMAYDYHHPASLPGSVDPIDWMGGVIDYAKSNIPANKLRLGLPLYGYDWRTAKQSATAVITLRMQALIDKYQAKPVLDEASQSLTFDYVKDGETHHVWFDDANATNRRIGLAKQKNLGGVIFWALGQEPAEFWK